jgi:hypothetical protein
VVATRLSTLSGAGAAAGTASPPTVDNYPPNAFTEFLRLPRLQRLSWTIRILGAAAVPEAVHNPLATELPETNLRGRYREGLASLEAIAQRDFGTPFVQLTAQRQTLVLDRADETFVTLLTAHTIEGMLCVPEYGGNRERRGWQLIGFGGDSQPLGYEIYDTSAPGHYRERPEAPNSGPNPDEDCHGFSSRINAFLRVISNAALTQPGRSFPSPYCFEVPA